MIEWCFSIFSHGKGYIVHHSSSIKGLQCNNRLHFHIFALALKEPSMLIYVKFLLPQCKNDIKYFRAYHKIVTVEKTISQKQTMITVLQNCLQQFTLCLVFQFVFQKSSSAFDLHDVFVWNCLACKNMPLGVKSTVESINLQTAMGARNAVYPLRNLCYT